MPPVDEGVEWFLPLQSCGVWYVISQLLGPMKGGADIS